MKNNISKWVLVLSLLFCTPLFAKEGDGFLKGPYITLSGTLLQWDWDVNQRTNVEEGTPWEVAAGLGFGWNIFDWFAPEMHLSFLTDSNNGRREHLAGVNIGPTFLPLFQAFLKSQKWKILPFARPFFGMQLVSLPSDTNAGNGRLTDIALGTGIGGGLRFLFNQNIYFGFEVEEAFFFHHNKHQILNPGGDTLIYKGGVKKQFQSSLMVGVHF